MKIKKAIDRIYWRFGGNDNKKPFPVNEGDIEAYNSIRDYVERKEAEQFQNHELFAKLFIFTYKRLFEIEGGNILDQGMVAKRRKIYNLLKKPTFQLVEEFTQMLNESEQYELIESVQGKIKHPATLSDEERVSNGERLKEAIREPENKSKLLGEVWDYETVKQALESEVNQAIEEFETY